MIALDACEQAALQADLESLLDKTCVITRNGTTIATVKALVRSPSAGVIAEYASKLGSLLTWQVQLPNGTDVLSEDHLLIENTEMLVQALLTPNSYSFLVNVLAAQVQ